MKLYINIKQLVKRRDVISKNAIELDLTPFDKRSVYSGADTGEVRLVKKFYYYK